MNSFLQQVHLSLTWMDRGINFSVIVHGRVLYIYHSLFSPITNHRMFILLFSILRIDYLYRNKVPYNYMCTCNNLINTVKIRLYTALLVGSQQYLKSIAPKCMTLDHSLVNIVSGSACNMSHGCT